MNKKALAFAAAILLGSPTLQAAQMCGDPFRAGNLPDIKEITTCFSIDKCETHKNKDYVDMAQLNTDAKGEDPEKLPAKVDVKSIFQ